MQIHNTVNITYKLKPFPLLIVGIMALRSMIIFKNVNLLFTFQNYNHYKTLMSYKLIRSYVRDTLNTITSLNNYSTSIKTEY